MNAEQGSAIVPAPGDSSRYAGLVGIWADDHGAWVLDRWQRDLEDVVLTTHRLSHWDGFVVEPVEIPYDGLLVVDVGADGTLWARPRAEGRADGHGEGIDVAGSSLVRFDGRGWTTFEADEGVPGMGGLGRDEYGLFVADDDGGVWLTPIILGRLECLGAARFDGRELRTFLTDRCVYGLDVGPGGDIWLQVLEDGGGAPDSIETYVIDAAVAGTAR